MDAPVRVFPFSPPPLSFFSLLSPPHSIHSPSIDGLGRRWHHPDCLNFSRTDGVEAGETRGRVPGSWDPVPIQASDQSACGQVTDYLGASVLHLSMGAGLVREEGTPREESKETQLSVGRMRGEGAGRLQKRARPSAILTGNQQALFKTDKSRNSSISKLFRNVKVNARENSDELKVAASEGWRGWEGGACMCLNFHSHIHVIF